MAGKFPSRDDPGYIEAVEEALLASREQQTQEAGTLTQILQRLEKLVLVSSEGRASVNHM